MINKITQFLKRIASLDIVKVFSLTSISTLVKMVAGFISVKIVSVIIGPSGVALVGQLNNFSSILLTLATGGIASGVTKYISEYKEDDNSIKSYIGTAIRITFVLSAICCFILLAGATFFSKKILLDSEYFYVFLIFGVTILLYSFNALFLAIINGLMNFGLYVKLSIVSSVFGLILSLILVLTFGLSGALINAVTNQSLIFIVAVIFCCRQKIFFLSREYIFGRFSKYKAVQYSKYSFMTIISTFGVPIGQLILRSYIIKKFGMEQAGCWEGMNRLSSMYLMVITSSFSVYYMPRLAEMNQVTEIKHEIIRAYKLLIPCMIFGFGTIYLIKDIVIRILFAPEFAPMTLLFKWQLLGDFFKISSWLIAFVMQAKAMVKTFCISEIVFSALYVLLGYLFTNNLGLGIEGVVIGYLIVYIIYFFAMYLFVWKRVGCISKK